LVESFRAPVVPCPLEVSLAENFAIERRHVLECLTLGDRAHRTGASAPGISRARQARHEFRAMPLGCEHRHAFEARHHTELIAEFKMEQDGIQEVAGRLPSIAVEGCEVGKFGERGGLGTTLANLTELRQALFGKREGDGQVASLPLDLGNF